MSIFGLSLEDPSDAYYQGLKMDVESTGEQFLEGKKAEAEQLAQQKMGATSGINKTPFIVIGVAGVVLLILVIIKKGYLKKGK